MREKSWQLFYNRTGYNYIKCVRGPTSKAISLYSGKRLSYQGSHNSMIKLSTTAFRISSKVYLAWYIKRLNKSENESQALYWFKTRRLEYQYKVVEKPVAVKKRPHRLVSTFIQESNSVVSEKRYYYHIYQYGSGRTTVYISYG